MGNCSSDKHGKRIHLSLISWEKPNLQMFCYTDIKLNYIFKHIFFSKGVNFYYNPRTRRMLYHNEELINNFTESLS